MSGLPVRSVRPQWASEYPASRVEDVKDTLFGTEVADPYRWLEPGTTPEVRDWMTAQDELTRRKLAALPEREALRARLRELFYTDSQGVPVSRGGRLFYMRRSGAQEKPVAYLREPASDGGAERILLDPNTWSEDGSTTLHGWSVSWDGKRVAYTVSENNSDEATLRVLDIDGGATSSIDEIAGAKYARASWTADGTGFYYVRLPVDPSVPTDERPGHAELCFHRLGTDPKGDPVVYPKTLDPTVFIGGGVSQDGRWLFAEVQHGWRKNDVYFRDLEAKNGEPEAWIPLSVGQDALYAVTAFRGRFYVWTNEGAPQCRLFVVDPARPARSEWRELVAERRDATLESVQVVGGVLALGYLKDVTTRLELRDLEGALIREIALPALGNAALSGDPDQDEAYYSFQTYNYPSEIHAISIARATDAIWFKLDVPVDPSAYVVEQIFFHSKDGTRVPMFVVHHKDLVRDGTAPTILSGYGGFSASETPSFRKGIFPWLERGGVYAAASLRGGAEYGEEWHRAGMLDQKSHVFEDFEAAAEALIAAKITSPGKLAISGGSNGGLLVGAVMLRRPELFRAVLCAVPLLDMVRYHLFGSGRTWIAEYGSAENEADFRVLYGYSPYHHVVDGTAYPSVLLDSADSDDRVDPLHARKFAAALQNSSSGGPVLLRIERNAGHGGADLMRAWVDRFADQYAFLLAEMRAQGATMGQ